MPDIDTLNIINIKIHSIGTEHGGGNDNCCKNKATAKGTDPMQETNRAEKYYTNTDSISKSDKTDKPMVTNKVSNTKDYFLTGPSCDSEKKRSTEIIQQLQIDFEDVFNGIGCFDGTLSITAKTNSKLYQVPLRCIAYMLQNLLRKSWNVYTNKTS